MDGSFVTLIEQNFHVRSSKCFDMNKKHLFSNQHTKTWVGPKQKLILKYISITLKAYG